MPSGRQAGIEIEPMRVVSFKKLDFPGAFPLLDLSFASQCRFEDLMRLGPYEMIDSALRGKAWDGFAFVLPDPPNQIIGHPNMQCPLRPARQHINVIHCAAEEWVPAFAGTAEAGRVYFVAATIESRRIFGMRSRISSGVASGGDRQIVSPKAGSALPGRARVRRPRDIASRETLIPTPSAGALVARSVTSSMPHIMPRPRMSPTTG